MQIPRYPNERCLLITDAGLGSLVLAAMASEQPNTPDQQRSTLYPAWWTSQSDMDLRIPAIDRAVQMQADLLSLTMIRDHAGYPEDTSKPASLGVHQTRMLLDAATLAIELGIKRVVWPIMAITPTDPDDLSNKLDDIATAIDRALLTARLATLDAHAHGGVEVVIETPLIDLTNKQLSDLAADLNVPINSCWWTDTTLPDAQAHATCWTNQPVTASLLELAPQQTAARSH